MPPPLLADAEALRAPRRRRSGVLLAAGGLRPTVRPARAPRPRALRWAQALPLLAAVGLNAPPGASAEPVPGVKEQAVAQLTTEKCDTCFTLEDYIAKQKYVYVLFYRSSGRLNIEMLGKFERTAEEWLHSRVAFGKIDTDRDKPMAEKWIKPGMVPTNIMFRNGEAVPVDDVGDFERLKSEFHANPEGQRWWLTKYLGDDAEGTNLHYVAPLKNAKSLKKALKKNKLTLVAFFEAAKGDAWEAFHEFAWSAQQPDGAKVADGTRLKAAALRLGFASAVGNVDFAIQGVPAPAVTLYKGGKASKVFALRGDQTRRDMVFALVDWVSGLYPVPPAPAPIEQEL